MASALPAVCNSATSGCSQLDCRTGCGRLPLGATARTHARLPTALDNARPTRLWTAAKAAASLCLAARENSAVASLAAGASGAASCPRPPRSLRQRQAADASSRRRQARRRSRASREGKLPCLGLTTRLQGLAGTASRALMASGAAAAARTTGALAAVATRSAAAALSAAAAR